MSLHSRSILRIGRTALTRETRVSSGILRLRGLATAPPSEPELKKTALYDFHLKNEAKMVPFAGYSMPLHYGKVSQVTSHHYVRSSVALFDVSHMVQSFFMGRTATGFIEWLTPTSLSVLDPFSTTLSVLLNEKGGIIDDIVICKHNDEGYFVVSNAGCREKDLAWFKQKLDEWNSSPEGAAGPVSHKVLQDSALVALQGPGAAAHLQQFVDTDIRSLTFGKAAYLNIDGARCHVMRGGYTGEDGFEIAIHPKNIENTMKVLTQSPVQLAGLGARDSLRLEAGMCLYGHDLNEDITPVEAGLSWVIGKNRRESGGFIGADVVLAQLKSGPTKRRVGFIVQDAPAREGAKIFAPGAEDSGSGEEIGVITSGIPSPTLQKNVAMGYIKSGFHKKGTEVLVEVRKKLRKAIVSPMPFVQTNYYRG